MPQAYEIIYMEAKGKFPDRIGYTNSVALKISAEEKGFEVQDLGNVDAERLKELQDSDRGRVPLPSDENDHQDSDDDDKVVEVEEALWVTRRSMYMRKSGCLTR
jgi:hypothetical protein